MFEDTTVFAKISQFDNIKIPESIHNFEYPGNLNGDY